MAEKTDFGSSWCTRITGFLLASWVWNLSEHPFAPAPPWQTSHGNGFTSPLLPVSAFVGMLSRCGFSGVSICPGLPRCALARCRRAQTFDYKGVAVMNLWALCWRSAGGRLSIFHGVQVDYLLKLDRQVFFVVGSMFFVRLLHYWAFNFTFTIYHWIDCPMVAKFCTRFDWEIGSDITKGKHLQQN